MPTYVITAKPQLLTETQKDHIAKFITQTHVKITGAPGYFVQVVFQNEDCRRYVCGKNSDSQIWIRGDIRSGRTVEQRKQLIGELVDGVSRLANVAKADIWIFLNNLEPTDMAEYGQILSEPGKEQEWFSALPKDIQNKFEQLEDEL